MSLREFPLNGVPCVECGRPGLAFVPPVGVKHRSGWCRIGYAEWPPVPLTPVIRRLPELRQERNRAA